MNKQERTYTILRDRIHSGAYPPMARLNIDAISRELGISPIPVREALRRLEAEGWVRFQPNVGAIVAPVDATTWEQEMVAVAILEGAATADAAARLRPEDLQALRVIAAEMEQACEAGDPIRFSELNRRWHATIIARCGNAYLVELLDQTYQRLDRLRSTMFAYLPQRSASAVGEHARLLGLLESGDAAEIERYARWHKLQTVEAYRALHPQAREQEPVALPAAAGPWHVGHVRRLVRADPVVRARAGDGQVARAGGPAGIRDGGRVRDRRACLDGHHDPRGGTAARAGLHVNLNVLPGGGGR